MPNSGFAQIWLQRMLKYKSVFLFDEIICKLDQENIILLWDFSWLKENNITSNNLIDIINTTNIFNKDIFDELDVIIKNDEVNIFSSHSL